MSSGLRTQARQVTLVACLAILTGVASVGLATPNERDERLLDELIGRHVGPTGSPGAAAVLVRRDGRTTLKGYGAASLAPRQEVDPTKTIFRVGSITKTFTALAVLQLVDEGKVDLMADANTYLKGVRIPSGDTCVRVIDLLTHRAGFDADLTYVGLEDSQAAVTSSDARLQRDILRLRPSGAIAVYDNMAWGLLGHIVESIDGIPYAQAIGRRIFQPLGMTRSLIGPPTHDPSAAVPYEVGEDGTPQPRPQLFLRRGWQGAGDASTTAADMALFLQMMLAEGHYPGGRMLLPATFQRFTDTTGFRLQAGVPGTGLGVYELGQSGGGAFGHGGTIRGFNALFAVLPRQEAAFFAVMNLNKAVPVMSASGLLEYLRHPPLATSFDPTDYVTIDLTGLLGQHLQPPAPRRPSFTDSTITDWSGRYIGMRLESYEALLPRLVVGLLIPPKAVTRFSDGSLQIASHGPYRPAAPALYRLERDVGPLLTEIGFAQVGGSAVMAPHTLQASRRLQWYERSGLTAAGLLLTPWLLLGCFVARSVLSKSPGTRLDRVEAALAIAIIGMLALELAFASEFQRVHGWYGAVLIWRSVLQLAIIGMTVASLEGIRRAWLTSVGAVQTRAARGYSSAIFALTVWLMLAAVYWQVLGKF